MGVQLRPTDAVISVPAKSGTIWTMHIFHRGLYSEVPWIGLRERPDQTTSEELCERWKMEANATG
jgi:hypothetical protein